MTSKERLDIIKQRINTIRLNTKIGSRRIADEENTVLLDHIEYNLNEIYKIVEREHELLELYKYLNKNTNDYDLNIDTVDEIHNKISEIQKLIEEE